MLGSIQVELDRYYQQLPTNMPEAAFKSAVFSFAVSTLFSGKIETGMATALLATTVSLVSGLTMPLFRKFLADGQGNMKWTSFAASQIVNLGLTQILVNSLTAYRVNIMSSLFFTVFFTGWINNFNDHPTDLSPFYVIA